MNNEQSTTNTTQNKPNQTQFQTIKAKSKANQSQFQTRNHLAQLASRNIAPAPHGAWGLGASQ
jgi:hypothetical protein